MSKKKKNKRSAKKTSKQQPAHSFDRRSMEKQLQDIGKLLSEHEFESIEEANAFLNELLSSGQGIPSSAPVTPLDKAQDVMYEAYEAHGRRRIKLARKAIKISEDCTDAYVLLAEEAARSAEEALELYEEGLRAAERTLGSERMAEYEGHFWGVIETRPYMRARAGVADALWSLGRREEAIEHLQALLRLNPNDNQGLRYFLAHALLVTERYGELSRLLRKYDEGTAYWTYTRALLAFRKKGETTEATRLLRQALASNRHVPAYLLGAKRLPRQMPDYVGFGDENEAIDYVDGNAAMWIETPGALNWLSRHAAEEDILSADHDPDWELEGPDSDILAQMFAEPEWAYAPFELDEWLKIMEIPRKEHAAVRKCLRRGVGIYSEAYYGRDRYKRQSQDIIDEQLEDPYIFGYAALEMLRNDRISDKTKEKVVNYALLILQPSMQNGVPHGLLEMLGFLAQQEQLSILHLMMGLLALHINSVFTFGPKDWTGDVTSPSMAALATWIATTHELEAEVKLWLVWKLGLQCDAAAHLGKALANTWLEHPQVPDHTKLQLCHSWLEGNREVGAPHYLWRLMLALIEGDTDEVTRIKEEYGAELDDFPLFEGDEVPLLPGEELDFTTTFHERRQLWASPYLKRLAIPWLVRLGEDLHAIIERYWEYGDDYDETYFKLGVRDAIAEFHEQLEPDELRRLVERGIDYGKVQVRKPFYLLSMDFYGDHYLEQALDDNATSLRQWAAKKLGL